MISSALIFSINVSMAETSSFLSSMIFDTINLLSITKPISLEKFDLNPQYSLVEKSLRHSLKVPI